MKEVQNLLASDLRLKTQYVTMTTRHEYDYIAAKFY